MHLSVVQWAERVIKPADVRGRRVVEVGSLNVNGSLRSLVGRYGPATYTGTDMQAGPGVDLAVRAEDLLEYLPAGSFDLLICTEMLEHAKYWQRCLMVMKQLLRVGGTMLLTTRGPGAGYHPYPEDHWRFTRSDLALAMVDFSTVDLRDDPDSPGVFYYGRRRRRAAHYPNLQVAAAPAA